MSRRTQLFQHDESILLDFREVLIDVEPIDPAEVAEYSQALPMPIFGTTGVGKTSSFQTLFQHALSTGQTFTFIDPKASIYHLSRRKAKKRLKAAGLRPSEANALIREIAGHGYQGYRLQRAMRHHHRKAGKWFPWDTLVS